MMLSFTEMNPTVGIDIDFFVYEGVRFITWDFSGKVWCLHACILACALLYTLDSYSI